MRASILAFACLTSALSCAPAQAEWKTYVSHTLAIAFDAPDGMKAEIGYSPRGTFVGTKEEMIFKTTDNNVDYSVAVINFAQAQEESETILGEADFLFQDGKRVVSDNFCRVGSGKDAIYGRKLTLDLPKQDGRATTAFYFDNGYLFQFTATVHAPGGDAASPDPARFINSIAFDPARAKTDAVELELPE